MCFMDSKSQTSISSELPNKMIDPKRPKPKEKRRYVVFKYKHHIYMYFVFSSVHWYAFVKVLAIFTSYMYIYDDISMHSLSFSLIYFKIHV